MIVTVPGAPRLPLRTMLPLLSVVVSVSELSDDNVVPTPRVMLVPDCAVAVPPLRLNNPDVGVIPPNKSSKAPLAVPSACQVIVLL